MSTLQSTINYLPVGVAVKGVPWAFAVCQSSVKVGCSLHQQLCLALTTKSTLPSVCSLTQNNAAWFLLPAAAADASLSFHPSLHPSTPWAAGPAPPIKRKGFIWWNCKETTTTFATLSSLEKSSATQHFHWTLLSMLCRRRPSLLADGAQRQNPKDSSDYRSLNGRTPTVKHGDGHLYSLYCGLEKSSAGRLNTNGQDGRTHKALKTKNTGLPPVKCQDIYLQNSESDYTEEWRKISFILLWGNQCSK